MAEFKIDPTQGKRVGIPLVIVLEGYSQSGKTKSGMEIMAGIGDEIRARLGREPKNLVVDTENRRGLHYADDYKFLHEDMKPPFSPEHYAAALDWAEGNAVDTIFFDSFSHVWSGEGGVKEWADRLEAGTPKPGIERPRGPKDAWDWWKDWLVRPVDGVSKWADPKSVLKPGYRWLIGKMLRSPCNIILGLRSDEKLRMESVPQFENDGQGGQRPKMFKGKQVTKTVITAPADMPILDRFVPECEKKLPYEITVSLLFVPANLGTPGMPIHRKVNPPVDLIFPQDQLVTRAAGRRLAEWAQGAKITAQGDGFDRTAELETMKRAADGGLHHLETVWLAAGSNVRRALEPELAGLKTTARAVDADRDQQEQQQQQGQDDGRSETDERRDASDSAGGEGAVVYDGP